MIPDAFKPCRIRLAALACALWGSICWGQQTAAAVKVEVAGGQGQYKLLRGGEPYVVKGAGAIVANYAELARRGGNSVRTWNIDMAQARLDQALEAGVTVSLCLPVVAPRYGFDYSDETFLVAQRTRVWAAVERYRDHPALLPGFAEGILSDTPFMITEWGPLGHWEVDATEWGAPIEQNSSSKAKHYLDQYRKFISPHLGKGHAGYANLPFRVQVETARR